jgi:hypothetical protein
MNISYLIYEAERPRGIAERRETDARAGELAAAVTRLGHSLRHPVTGKRHVRRDGQRLTGTTVPCAIPRPRQPADL